jgi:peptidoglycan/LPS O-acetylase OafA/YrhL
MRNLQLDVLRAVAILGVLTVHIVLFRVPPRWLYYPVHLGWTGVDLFFVLSGFLISGLLFSEFQKTGGIAFRRFAFRRAMKIWPPFYVLIVFTLLRNLSAGQPYRSVLVPFMNDVLFLNSYRRGTYGHFWSLGVEEHFYILLPIALYWMMRVAKPGDPDPFRRLPRLFLIVAVGVLAARVVTALAIPRFDYYAHFFPTHLRIDSLLFGVLLSYYSRFHGTRFWALIRRRGRLLLLSSMALVWFFVFSGILPDPAYYTVGFTALYLGFGTLMVVFLQARIPSSGWPRALLNLMGALGRYSYSIYLWHRLILDELKNHHLLKGPAGLVIYYVACIAFGVMLSLLIETPALAIRDRLSARWFPGPPARDPQTMEGSAPVGG